MNLFLFCGCIIIFFGRVGVTKNLPIAGKYAIFLGVSLIVLSLPMGLAQVVLHVVLTENVGIPSDISKAISLLIVAIVMTLLGTAISLLQKKDFSAPKRDLSLLYGLGLLVIVLSTVIFLLFSYSEMLGEYVTGTFGALTLLNILSVGGFMFIVFLGCGLYGFFGSTRRKLSFYLRCFLAPLMCFVIAAGWFVLRAYLSYVPS